MSLFRKLVSALKTGSVSPEDWTQLRQQLIASDLGVNLVDQVIEKAKSTKSEDAVSSISSEVSSWLSNKSRSLMGDKGITKTILVVGVNGTGKTTSTAKLANYLVKNGNSVLLAAADTFRAAATEQLQTWAKRIDVEVVSGSENSDPAAVAFTAVSRAKELKVDYLIVDTAGRLHTKQNLMDELGKIVRVIQKQSTVDEILLVIDATTGQNGLNQANVFIEAVGVTGFIVTKIDGSAKGGVAIAIEKSSGLPIKFIGTGEQIEDFGLFAQEAYIAGLFD
jgi:fused signal recognition particle receptor